MHEFFSDKLSNFVEPDHVCTCNVCCLDIESIKKKAVEEALAVADEARRALVGLEGARVHEESKNLDP